MQADPEIAPFASQAIHNQIKQMLQFCQVKEESLDKLPKVFLQFLDERGLKKQELIIQIPRYVRVKPSVNIYTEELAEKLGLSEKQVVQVDSNFWAINPKAKINHCQLYQQGLLYGMDYSSAIPVKCLSITENNRILELCCAPGNKSMLMADSHANVTIKGVEINENRANIMKSMIKKYKHEQKIEVIVADGLKYRSQELFDRVLVDAECTHEGSLKHIYKFFKDEVKDNKELKVQKQLSKQQEKQFRKNNTNPYTSEITKSNQWTKQDFQQRFLDPFKLSQLNKLQFGLLENGFKLLKNGGILVYSTCSFDYLQNEKIIEDFLEKEPFARLVNAGKNLETAIGWKYGRLQGTLRLSPSVSFCGGMFVAKLTKLQP